MLDRTEKANNTFCRAIIQMLIVDNALTIIINGANLIK